MNIYTIPLANKPQRFGLTLLGVNYEFIITWRKAMGAWMLDINDQEGNPLVLGTALVTGLDLLGQYQELGIGGQLIMVGDDPYNWAPTENNLGLNNQLYFVTP